MVFLQVFGGLVLLFLGGEMLVRGAVNLANRLGISSLLVGLTIVGFGTSMPELMVAINAALDGQPDIAMGNIVGSNISNILLILGVSGLIQPIICPRAMVIRDGSWMMAATILVVILGVTGVILFWHGVIMLLSIASYIGYSYWNEKYRSSPSATLHEHEAEAFQNASMAPWLSVTILIIGLGALVYGADILVEGAVSLARGFGISEAVIGLSLVAVGTSLPELATSIVAAFRKHADVAIGNIIGSNIYNLLGILGTTALVKNISVNPQIVKFDLWVMLGVSILLGLFMFTEKKISRNEAGVLLALYIGYIGILYIQPGFLG